MIQKLTFVVLVLAITVQAIHLKQNHEAGLTAGNVKLVADNGEYLRICLSCGAAVAASASIQPATNDNTQTWTLEVVGTQVAFKGSYGLYLSRCNGCWSGVSSSLVDSATVHVANRSQPAALWTPVLQSNGKYSFKSNNGKYLARCNGCAKSSNSSNFAFVHESNASNAYAQWSVQYVADSSSLRQGLVTIKSDNGGFLHVCQNCGTVNAVSVESGTGPKYQWKIVKVGTNIALQGSNGNYLTRCRNCYSYASDPDTAFVKTTTIDVFSQLTPIRNPNGSWSFKCDLGKLLIRCNGCTFSKVYDLAFFKDSLTTVTSAQWTITYV